MILDVRHNVGLDLIGYFRNRVNDLLNNYYGQENILCEPLNSALLYSRRRLRATLAYCGNGIVGGTPESVDKIAMAYEIITANYVLMDDSIIMDAGVIRADKPTPRIAYGEIPALLSACIIQLEPIRLLPENKHIQDVFYNSARDTVTGWFLEHKLAELSVDDFIDEQEILHVSRLLTGPLLAGALTSGAIIGGATLDQIDALYRYAMDFGCAYQISDHIVDLMLSSDNSGKDNFSDIQTNKKTIVINHALQSLPSDSPQRHKIINAIGNIPSTSKKRELQSIFIESKSIEHCLNRVTELSNNAISHLKQLPYNKYRSLLEKIPQMYMEELLKSMSFALKV